MQNFSSKTVFSQTSSTCPTVDEDSYCCTVLHTHSQYDSPWWVISLLQRPLHTQHKHMKQNSMPPAGFKTVIPAIEWPQTYTLALTATGISSSQTQYLKFTVPLHPHIRRGLRGSFPSEKTVGVWSNYSAPSTVKIRNEWNYTYMSSRHGQAQHYLF